MKNFLKKYIVHIRIIKAGETMIFHERQIGVFWGSIGSYLYYGILASWPVLLLVVLL